MNSVYLKEDQVPELRNQKIKSIAQATTSKLVVLTCNTKEDFDSIYIVDRDQKPISLIKIPLVCNLLDLLTKTSTPAISHLKNVIPSTLRFSALKMLKNLDDSCLIFD